jgi:hypothetical protein
LANNSLKIFKNSENIDSYKMNFSAWTTATSV